MNKNIDLKKIREERDLLLDEITKLDNTRSISILYYFIGKYSLISLAITIVIHLLFDTGFAGMSFFYFLFLVGFYLFSNRPLYYQKEDYKLPSIFTHIIYMFANPNVLVEEIIEKFFSLKLYIRSKILKSLKKIKVVKEDERDIFEKYFERVIRDEGL